MALGSGCMATKETREGAGKLRDQLGTPSWASSVDVESGRDGQLNDSVRTTVTLASSATPGQVADFVVAMPDEATKAGLENTLLELVFLTSDGARLDVAWGESVVPDEVTRGVTEWFGVAQALGSAVAAKAKSDGGASYVVTLGDGPVTAVLQTYLDLAALTQPDTASQVTATVGSLALDLSASVPPTMQQLDTWDALLKGLGKLPADLPAAQISLHFLDRIVASVVIVAPDDTTPESFTVASYGDRVWPVVHPQLDAMAGLPDAWSYFVSWVPVSTPTSQNLFISLLSDQDPTDNGDESTRWSQAAKAYVDGR
jgi:hypothetical protein